MTTLFYTADHGTPWSGLGEDVTECPTSEEAIVRSGLDWEVALGPVYGPRASNRDGKLSGVKVIPGQKCIYRTDNFDVLGFATPSYQTFSNRECFSFLDSLVSDGVMRYVTAFSRKGGKEVYIVAGMQEGWQVNGEAHTTYIVASTRHDTGGAVRAAPYSLRMACLNQIKTSMFGGVGSVSIVHRANMEQKLAEAREVLAITTDAQRNLAAWLERAQAYKLAKGDYDKVTTGLFGSLDDDSPKQRRDAVERFRAIYGAEEAINGPTAYSLFNAVTGYSDHARATYRGEPGSVKVADRRFFDIESRGGIFKAKGAELLTSLSDKLAVPA